MYSIEIQISVSKVNIQNADVGILGMDETKKCAVASSKEKVSKFLVSVVPSDCFISQHAGKLSAAHVTVSASIHLLCV